MVAHEVDAVTQHYLEVVSGRQGARAVRAWLLYVDRTRLRKRPEPGQPARAITDDDVLAHARVVAHRWWDDYGSRLKDIRPREDLMLRERFWVAS